MSKLKLRAHNKTNSTVDSTLLINCVAVCSEIKQEVLQKRNMECWATENITALLSE